MVRFGKRGPPVPMEERDENLPRKGHGTYRLSLTEGVTFVQPHSVTSTVPTLPRIDTVRRYLFPLETGEGSLDHPE